MANEELMKAVWRKAVVAESDRTVVVDGNHYFPPDSVKVKYLRASRRCTFCPLKGIAHHHRLDVDGEVLRRAAWSYPHPLPWVRRLRDHVAFSSEVEVTPG